MSSLEDHTTQARLEMEQGDYGGAIRSLTEALAIERADSQLYLMRGLAYFMRHDYDLTIEDMTAVLAVDHQNRDAILTRAHAHFHRQEWDDALQDYNEYIALVDDDSNLPYARRALVLTQLNQTEEAIDDYTRAIEQGGEIAQYYYHRATLYYALGAFAETIADATQAIERGFPAPEVYETRGSAHAQLQQWQQAHADYDKAVALDRRSTSAYYNRGAVLYQLGALSDAISDFSTALKINPEDSATRYARASAYLAQGDALQARRDLSYLIKQDSEHPAVYHKRAEAYYQLQQYDKAYADQVTATQLAPTQSAYLMRLGELEIEREAYLTAIGVLKRALFNRTENDTRDHQRNLGGLALAYYLNADDERASDYYNQLLAQDLDYGDAPIWQVRFGWSDLLIDAVKALIEAVESTES